MVSVLPALALSLQQAVLIMPAVVVSLQQSQAVLYLCGVCVASVLPGAVPHGQVQDLISAFGA